MERGSLSAVAEHLDISRSKVTRYLSELEKWMDTRLLHRTTRSLSLTTAGKETLDVARELLALEDLLNGIRDQNALNLKGQLRITASYSIVESCLVDVIRQFVERWPEVSIDILSTDKAVNLVDSRVDLAIRITNDLSQNAVAKHIGECHSIICAAHLILRKKVDRVMPKILNIITVYPLAILAVRHGRLRDQMDENPLLSKGISVPTLLRLCWPQHSKAVA